MGAVLEWAMESLSRFDILDLHVVLSDLIDIPLTDADRVEMAYYDSMAMDTMSERERRHHEKQLRRPKGMRVY